ncbi:uncharacterized protein At3g49140 isoform X2 [Coffea arabica]|uniref:Uncharacterized protein At3g49140 isoform X2 n=1 Tax=Coffea arabica TaxID=13443 RepID=A0ABM4WCI4_COFAR
MLMLEPPAAAVLLSRRSFDPIIPRRLPHSATFFISRNKYSKLRDHSCPGNSSSCASRRNGIRASAKEQPNCSGSGSGSGPVKQNAKPLRYHPFEEIAESELNANGEARLTPAETTRTLIEQVIIGLDTAEMLSEIELLGQSEIDFGIDEFDDEDSDVDDEDGEDEGEDDNGYEKDWVAIIDNDEDQDEDSDGSLGDWAKLETMRSSHPMYFAKKLSEAASDDPIDFMDQPPAGLAIQGLLRPAFVEEHAVIQKHITDNQIIEDNTDQITKMEGHKENEIIQINGHKHEHGSAQEGINRVEELESDETPGNGTSFYKLEMVKIQLISAHGNQNFVEIEDFRRARPDAIAHSAAKIISRLKAGGEKTTQALKSLCWRCKGIQVEEVALIGVDSIGFDLRVCSGTQVQTLRFAFNKRASSEYSAERQLNHLLFPRANHKLQQKKEAHQTEL